MKEIVLMILIFATMGCGKDKAPSKDKPVLTKAQLVKPIQNELCLSGVIISNSQSVVTFEWIATENTDGYELVVKNLESGLLTSHNTQNLKYDVTLQRNTPYSWFVNSKSSQTPQIAKSDIWKFYNAGVGNSSYAPYPADLIFPSLNEIIIALNDKISLNWKGSDPDNDIVSYTLYFGTTSTPEILKAGLTDMVYKDISVTTNTIYYWKVITKDNHGNTSDSGIFSFKVK